jgi:hypothetical protein
VGQRKDMLVGKRDLPTVFTTDRFGLPNSAIQIKPNYVKLPQGVYLAGSFTVTFWIYLNGYNVENNARIIEITESADKNNQNFNLFFSTVNRGFIKLGLQTLYYCEASNYEIPLLTWSYVAVTYDGNKAAYIYIDGILRASCPTAITPRTNLNFRTSINYIGKANLQSHLADTNWLLNGALDELKFYDRVLSPSEIENDMTSAYMINMPLGLPNMYTISK